MRQFYLVLIATTLLSCSTKSEGNQVNSSDTVSVDRNSLTTIPSNNNGGDYLTSTYDHPSRDLDRHKASLKELSDSAVFSTIHGKSMQALDKKHQDYFNSNTGYQIISHSSGDLFQNGKKDSGFMVYDRNHTRVSILVYDELQNAYSELFRDIKVRNGLGNADCDYFTFGTPEYQLAEELIYQRDYLMKDPLEQIGNTKSKIADISEDETFVLDVGCFAQGFSADARKKSLCIPTSSVYNNWECLTYDGSKREFVLFYGQAFAD